MHGTLDAAPDRWKPLLPDWLDPTLVPYVFHKICGPLVPIIPSPRNGQEVNECFWASEEKEDGRVLPLPYTKEEILKVYPWVPLNTLSGWEAV